MTEPSDLVVSQPAYLTGPVQPDQESESVPLATVLRRRWPTMLLLGSVLGSISCAAIWLLMHPMYEVRAAIHVAPIVQPILFSDMHTDISRQYRAYVAMQTIMMTSPLVVSNALNTPEVQSLAFIQQAEDPMAKIRQCLSAEHEGGTELVYVTMVGDAPRELVVILNNILAAYLRVHEEKKRESDDKTLSTLRAEREVLVLSLGAQRQAQQSLAAGGGLSTVEADSAFLNGLIAETQQQLMEAEREYSLATERLKVLLNGEDDDPAGFDSYVQDDQQWQDLRNQLVVLRLAHIDDERLGRGSAHPDVATRPKLIEALTEMMAERRSELRANFAKLRQRGLDATELDSKSKVTSLHNRLEQLEQQRSQVASTAYALEDASQERERLESSMQRIKEHEWQFQVEQGRMARLTIWSPPIAPESPNIDKRLKYMVVACAMSLFLAAAVALLRDRADTSVRDPREVPRRLGMPLLGSVLRVQNTNGDGLIRDERVLETMRGISAALRIPKGGALARSRLLTSPTAQSGKSSLAMNLAHSVAATGRRVLLVDADNVRQGVTQGLGLTGRTGLREFLDGTCPSDQVVYASDVQNLQVIPAGKHDTSFGALLSRQHTQENLRSLFESFDEVIVDSPPVLASSNAVLLATFVDEVILVLRAGKSTREEAQAARQCLATVGSKLVGVILNAVDPRTTHYGYGYGYANPAGQDEDTQTADA